IVYAFTELPRFADLCLNSEACNLTADERELLTKIKTSHEQEKAVKEPLKFLSEKKQPGFFIIDGQVKIAKTGNNVGDTIYFNTDLLYPKNSLGQIEAFSIADGLAHLLHELGHHQGSKSHTELDLLGVKVSMILNRYIQTTPLLPHSQEVSAVAINDRSGRGFPQILLYVFGEVINISEDFEKTVKCSKVTVPISSDAADDLKLGATKPLGTIFHNVHWTEFKLKSDEGDFAIKGNLSNYCRTDQRVNFNDNRYKAVIKFDVRRDKGGAFKLKKDSLSIKQKFEPWWKIIQLPDARAL
ncbi:MAG: hypothetical protein ABL958_21745, partial [Bdellovibrionia bacterium]